LFRSVLLCGFDPSQKGGAPLKIVTLNSRT
jgi:hypothetical protein